MKVAEGRRGSRVCNKGTRRSADCGSEEVGSAHNAHLEDLLRLVSREALHDPLDRDLRRLSLEVVDNRRRREVAQRQVEAVNAADLLARGGAPVEGLDVRRVEAEGGGAVVDDLVELVQVGVARCAVGVEDCLLLALDRLGVVRDRLRELLPAVQLVAARLERERKLGALLPMLYRESAWWWVMNGELGPVAQVGASEMVDLRRGPSPQSQPASTSTALHDRSNIRNHQYHPSQPILSASRLATTHPPRQHYCPPD